MVNIIEIRDLSYCYPDGTRALDRVSLNVAEGESLAVIGPNGAGKSTLLLHLNGILTNQQSVRVLGQEVNQSNLKFIRSKVGLVFQDPDHQLFMPTVREDVAYGPMNMDLCRVEIEKRVRHALQQVDMEYAGSRLAHHLSLGEKKRIAIATVLSMNPEVLVLDEPSSNLDPRHRRDLINLLNRLIVTKVIATHDLDLVLDTCQRVVLLDRGSVAAEGAPDKLLGDKILLEKHDLEVPYRLR